MISPGSVSSKDKGSIDYQIQSTSSLEEQGTPCQSKVEVLNQLGGGGARMLAAGCCFAGKDTMTGSSSNLPVKRAQTLPSVSQCQWERRKREETHKDLRPCWEAQLDKAQCLFHLN